ncbi:syntaxin [Tripterygium wilfordii]|uniref:Syntaxin n=1 Tax=Tripterygium wilfordii TaxID=458696 RepID=A0A7J7C6G0_TRIWF|nr:syntaxin [Tripterygium wilfordii]
MNYENHNLGFRPNAYDDIGSHIESSHAATAQGKSQLVKASKTQRSNSSLTCLLLVIFGIVLLIVIIVLVA